MSKNPLDIIRDLDEELFKGVQLSRDLAFKEGALSVKEKYLIAMALDAAHGASDGVLSLAKQAQAAGASKKEIMEALRVAFYVTGAGSIYTAARVLDSL